MRQENNIKEFTDFWDVTPNTLCCRWTQRFFQNVGIFFSELHNQEEDNFYVQRRRKLKFYKRKEQLKTFIKYCFVPSLALCSSENNLVSKTDFFLMG
jgi:hypothetical protein